MPLVLVLDDDTNTRRALAQGLAREGYETVACADGQEALDLLRQRTVDLALVDLKMPGMDGLSFLKTARHLQPDLAVIVISGHGSIDDAVEAMKLGAYDFLTKPIRLPPIRRLAARALETRELQVENRELRERVATQALRDLIGEAPRFHEVIGLARQAAASRATILLRGESGTGKEVLARAIHGMSQRAQGPFRVINCAAIPENLLESELFGHEKGAFTGADRAKPGRLEQADGGTVLLDEIGDMPLAVQAKMLRVLQEGEIERLGDTGGPRRVDLRVVGATHRDLEALVRQGTFREDLYYRLNVITIELPPLRERPEDIMLLAAHFAAKYGKLNGRNISGFSAEARECLLQHAWPGNVRELENAIERAVVLAPGEQIERDSLPAPVSGANGTDGCLTLTLGTSLEQAETELIRKTLEMTGGDKEAAANILGIGIATLYRKMKSAEPPPDEKDAAE